MWQNREEAKLAELSSFYFVSVWTDQCCFGAISVVGGQEVKFESEDLASTCRSLPLCREIVHNPECLRDVPQPSLELQHSRQARLLHVVNILNEKCSLSQVVEFFPEGFVSGFIVPHRLSLAHNVLDQARAIILDDREGILNNRGRQAFCTQAVLTPIWVTCMSTVKMLILVQLSGCPCLRRGGQSLIIFTFRLQWINFCLWKSRHMYLSRGRFGLVGSCPGGVPGRTGVFPHTLIL